MITGRLRGRQQAIQLALLGSRQLARECAIQLLQADLAGGRDQVAERGPARTHDAFGEEPRLRLFP